MTKALIVVDVQNDFVTGSLRVPCAETVTAKISTMLDTARQNYDLIVATQDWHQNPGDHWSDQPDYITSWPKHCEAYSWGAQLHKSLPPVFNTRCLKGQYEAAYSGFDGKCDGGQYLDEYLREHKVTEVDVCGLALDYCVSATALDLNAAGYKTRVLIDLTASVSSVRGVVRTMRTLSDKGIELVR